MHGKVLVNLQSLTASWSDRAFSPRGELWLVTRVVRIRVLCAEVRAIGFSANTWGTVIILYVIVIVIAYKRRRSWFYISRIVVGVS